MTQLIGREHEMAIFKDALESNEAELIAVYGRRRVGKTFLIREYFKGQIVFEVAGMFKGNLADQLLNFSNQLAKFKKEPIEQKPDSWMAAFLQLEAFIEKQKSKKKRVLFIDEFPWMATPRSKFLMAFESFWNQFCSKRNDLVVIICGSAASYMIKNVVANRGGLHNRITRQIRLLPFNLLETELYLKSKKINYTRYDILKLYMSVGGIPHYLKQLDKGKSLVENIDSLCFKKDGVLVNEFDKLFNSLFENSERHQLIVDALAKKNKGLTRAEIIESTKLNSGGDFSLKLKELIESGFVSEYAYYQNKKQLSLYRLSDEYSWFYKKYIESNKGLGAGTWKRLSGKRSYQSWAGFAFESICLKYVQHIKHALRIDVVYSTNSSWFNEHAQIDLLIDRDDNVINLCEMKFNDGPFNITKAYYEQLKNKVYQFKESTNTRKNLFLTMITTYGVTNNAYSNEMLQNSVKMDALFEKL
ncbi:MAG: AAA family ATPase [Bacteroidetes bacterium]|nr:AAA family ATPase [Bacteroidota bacterium]